MKNRFPLTDASGEVRELTEEDFKQFKPAAAILPKSFLDSIPKPVGRPAGQSKHLQRLRIDNDILSFFKATGKGWQTRMNDALKEWIAAHPAQ